LFLALREDHRLRVFENRALRGIFGSRKILLIGDWRELDNEELHNLYSSSCIRITIITKSEMGKAFSTNGDKNIDGKARRKETTRKRKT
jgi:hypothetical protein